MSELRDRLERLATRGAPRGADDVLGAAMRQTPLDTVGLSADPDDGDHQVADDDVPFVTIEPDAHRRGRFGLLVASVGVVALVGVGGLAAAAIFGNGGAGSPESAVRQLADAISHKDPLAAVDVLAPTEVRTMRDTVKDATQRAADLKVVDDASQPLAGVDLSVNDLQLSTETLADGYAKVTVTSGVLSASTHEAAMSKMLQDALGSSGTGTAQTNVDLSKIAANADLPTFVVTVRRDGRWYVSPAYTALEYAREAAGGPPADFGSANAANLGADSPEDAVSGALRAWQAGKWDQLMALAPPDELPVYDYRAWIDQEASAADAQPDFTIDTLTTSATVNGDTAVVKLDASGTNGTGDSQEQWQVGGTCPIGGGSGYSFSSASGSSDRGVQTYPSTDQAPTGLCLSGDLGDALPFGLFVVSGPADATATGPVSVETVREDGRWFVSPVSTALDAVDSAIEHLDQRTLYTDLGLAYQLPPDATITLDQPFSVPNDTYLDHVFAFDGTAGQRVVGAADGGGKDFFASGQLYTADGTDVGFVEFDGTSAGFAGPPTTLPSTGSYRLVVTGGTPEGATLTLFDAAHAPKSLVSPEQGDNIGGGEICTHSLLSTSCQGSVVGVPTAIGSTAATTSSVP